MYPSSTARTSAPDRGYLVLRAAKWAADGLTARNICMRLQSLANRVELSFVLNQLNYMAKILERFDQVGGYLFSQAVSS